jgi:spore germination protein YaaH
VAYAASLVDPANLLIGLPAYAYDWDLSALERGEDDAVGELYWTDIPDILSKSGMQIQRDTAAQSPYLTYTERGHEHEVWYEDAVSIQAKSRLVSHYGLGGLSVWALGQEDGRVWEAVSEDNT